MDIEFSQRFKLEAYPEKRRLIRGYVLMGALAVLIVSLGFSAWNRSDQSADVQLVMLRSAGTLRYLDEVLTMSARMASATTDPRWQSRYRDAAHELDETLRQARNHAPQLRGVLEQIAASNERLLAQEDRAFQLLSQGKATEASTLLQDRDYETAKEDYAEGLKHLSDRLQAQHATEQAVMRRELGLLGSMAFALLCLMGSVLYSNHRMLVRRIELEQALGVVAKQLIRVDPARLDGEIQAVLRLLAALSKAPQVWLLQRHGGPAARLVNSWFHDGTGSTSSQSKLILKALLDCEANDTGALTLESGSAAHWAALGVTALEGVILSTSNGQFLLVLVGRATSRLRWNHREAAILQSIGEVLIRAIENRALQEQLLRLATTDGLTGLINRRHFDDLLQREWSRAAQAPLPTAVLMLDIDRFKLINDKHGHGTGDSVLAQLAHRLREELRDIDLIARIGGEEFALLLPGTEIEGALDAAERLRAKVESMVVDSLGAGSTLTISIGVTLMDRRDADANASLKRADQALYAAKAAGRNCVRYCLAAPATEA